MNIDLYEHSSVVRIFRIGRLSAILIFISLTATCAQAASVESLSKDKLVPEGNDAFWLPSVSPDSQFTVDWRDYLARSQGIKKGASRNLVWFFLDMYAACFCFRVR